MSAPDVDVRALDHGDAATQELADALIAGRPAPPIDDAQRLALAWALKARCYAAWSSAPETAGAIAAALDRLATPTAPAAVCALAAWTGGIAAIVRADLPAALDALDQSATRWSALGDALHAAQVQVPRIAALAMLGRFDEADACGRAARTALEAAGDTSAAARVSLNLGSLAVQRDRYDDALPHYRAAAALFARSGDREHSVMADIGLANALVYRGDFAEAERILERARQRAQRHRLPVLAAGADTARAAIDLARGDFRAALARLEASRRAFESLGLETERMEAEKSLADAYLELHLFPEAEAVYAALELALRDTPRMPTLAWIRLQRARAAAMTACDGRALALLDDAHAAFEAQANAVGDAHVALVLAQVQLAAGDARALATSARAADTFARLGLTRPHAAARVAHADALRAAGRFDAAVEACTAAVADAGPQTRVQACTVRGQALLERGDRDAGAAALDEAIDAFEALRERVPGDELRRAFVGDVMRPYRLRLAITLDDATTGDARAVERAFAGLERFKARALAERLAGAPAAAHDPRSADLRTRLDWLHRRQQEQLEDSGAMSPSLHDEALRIERELLETQRRAVAFDADADPATRAGGNERSMPDPRDVLAVDEAIVEYGVVGDELFAFVVDRTSITLHRRLASWRAVVDAVQGLRFQIETLRRAPAALASRLDTLRERLSRRLAQVHRHVWHALAARVHPYRGVVVVPHGVLHGLPFAALDGGQGALIERHCIAVAPNAASLARRTAPRHGAPVLLIGDATALAHVRAELDAAAAAWPGARVLADADIDAATLEQEAPRVALMHLACHASFRPDNPRFSWLQLGGSRVLACDVERWRMPGATVVLSGCETAVSDPDTGDEALGLVRAFQLAGATRVVGSLWPVEDGATADLMSTLHAGLAKGRPAAEALVAAQRRVRADRDDPFDWAGFMVHGGL
jgi:tetratricopeptide (TPR) repeat protein